MSDKPMVYGYEWGINCPCGEIMATNGMGRTDADGKAKYDRRSDEIPNKDGDTITCESCGETWVMEFSKTDS